MHSDLCFPQLKKKCSHANESTVIPEVFIDIYVTFVNIMSTPDEYLYHEFLFKYIVQTKQMFVNIPKCANVNFAFSYHEHQNGSEMDEDAAKWILNEDSPPR